jgi:hypothetical protein
VEWNSESDADVERRSVSHSDPHGLLDFDSDPVCVSNADPDAKCDPIAFAVAVNDA